MNTARHNRGRGLLAWLGLLLVFGAGVPERATAAEAAAEADVKAALLNAFCKLTNWSAERAPVEGRPIVVGFFNAPEVMTSFKREFADGKTESFQTVDVDSAVAARDCHLVYFGDSGPRTIEVLTELLAAPVLTVGEQEPFARAGGIMAFERREGRVAYHINLRAMDKAGVRLDPRLVRNAIAAKGGDQ